MKAIAVIEKGRVEIVDVPAPAIGEYECLVRIKACGLCNATDLKIINDEIADMTVDFPVILGHEAAGEVVEVGAKVRNFAIGDRVINPEYRATRGSRYSGMWGNMAEYGVIRDVRAMTEDGEADIDADLYAGRKIPDEITNEDGAVVLSLKENLSALRNLGLQQGMDVLVYGDGPVGLGLVAFSRMLGAGWVGCVGHRDDRLERASRIGKADLVINSHNQDAQEAIEGRRFDLVVDAVGKTQIIIEAAGMLKPGGKVGIYGVIKPQGRMLDLLKIPDHVAIHKLTFPYKEHVVHNEIVEMIVRGRIDPKDYYSHVVPMEEVERGIGMIKTREAFKVILSF